MAAASLGKGASPNLCNPILVCCLGGEMIFILEQRLSAQKVAPRKCGRVIEEIVTSCFAPSLADTLFSPQPTFVIHQLRKMFIRLAHSSIMRLSEQSMDKLFDLMCMGLKHQAVCVREPFELLAIVLNHIEAVTRILSAHDGPNQILSKQVQPLVATFRDRVLSTFSIKTRGEMMDIQEEVLNVLQGKVIKVSLLLKHGFQNADGFMKLTTSGQLPVGFEIPGVVKHYSKGKIISEDTMPLLFNKPANPAIVVSPITDHKNIAIFQEHCSLGQNMYDDFNNRRFPVPSRPTSNSEPTEKQDDEHTSRLEGLATFLSLEETENNFVVTLELHSDEEEHGSVQDDNSIIIGKKEKVENLIGDIFENSENTGEKADGDADLLSLMDGLGF